MLQSGNISEDNATRDKKEGLPQKEEVPERIIFLFYEQILSAHFGMLEVETYFKGYLCVINLGNAVHCTVGCAELMNVGVVLPLYFVVSAALELEHISHGSVEDVVLDNEVCRVNNSTGSDMCGRGLVGTGYTEAITCKTTEVVLVENVYKVSCGRILAHSVEVFYGVYTSCDYIV